MAAGCPLVCPQPEELGRAGQLLAAAGCRCSTVPLPSWRVMLSKALCPQPTDIPVKVACGAWARVISTG